MGYHPLYNVGEAVSEYKLKLKNPEWKLPFGFSELAKDLFLKLVKLNPFGRYTGKQALNHPWITRIPNIIHSFIEINPLHEICTRKLMKVYN
jgi:serine/threonine protein kinase